MNLYRLFLMILLAVMGCTPVTGASDDIVFLPPPVKYEQLPVAITGDAVDRIMAYGREGLLIQSGHTITVLSESSISILDFPESLAIDDLVVDPGSGYIFISSGKTIYVLNGVEGYLNKFLSIDDGPNRISMGEDILYVCKKGDSKLLRVQLIDGVLETVDTGGLIDQMVAANDCLLLSVNGRIALLANNEVLPIVNLGTAVTGLASTDSDWIAYSTETEVGVIKAEGKRVKLRNAGARGLHYSGGALYIINHDRSVSIFNGLNEGIANLP